MDNQFNANPARIVMYTTAACSECFRAKAFFDANHIDYLGVGLEGNAEATEFVMRVNHGMQSVPTIVFPDGSVLVEPSWEELKRKISIL